MKINPKPTCVSIRAPARLHLGFLDMHGGLHRKFGSLGLAIDGVETSITAEYADNIDINGPSAERAGHYAKQILSCFGINGGIKLSIKSAIPEHVGLGSGTQLSLAVATAITRLYGRDDQDPAHLAAVLQRGARSGIGIGSFMYGGFIVDGGRGSRTEVPPVISRIPFPAHWRIVLIFDDEADGMSGVSERHAFNILPPMSKASSGELCRLTMMQVLPAVCEKNYGKFGAGITHIQNIIGDYFSAVQGGRYTSPFLEPILDFMYGEGAAGIGQSSWGATGFSIFSDETIALQALQRAGEKWRSEPGIRFLLTTPRNTGAFLSPGDAKADTAGGNLKFGNR